MNISQAALATIHRPTFVLMQYDAACRAVAAANSVDEVKDIRDKSEAMRAYAKQAKNKQLEVDASEIRFRAERRIGEMMEAQARGPGFARPGPKIGSELDPNYLPSLADNGIDKHLADRARKYAAIPEEQFEEILSDRRERIETENKRVTVNLIEAGIRGTFGTGENEWYTPDEYVEAARDVLGTIDLDPATSEAAQGIIRATTFYTAALNGLSHEWRGRVWLNPPYSQPLIGEFISKLIAEIESKRVDTAILLTHNYTDTAWFHHAAEKADAICFTRGRIRFFDPNGNLASPTQGQAFFYYGAEVEKFCERFEGYGFFAMPPASHINNGRE